MNRTAFVLSGLLVAVVAQAGSWDITAPPGPKGTAVVDTDEGTWMDLDVSPDGKSVVFDLLGDLFVMGIEGGDARPLATGLAFETQPRFSPDGRHIAYVSDRSGIDNIWIMERDGSNARQLTDERYRWPSVPAWSPDGRYIVARKHYTAARSIGAGEIWMFAVSGGTGGTPLVERQSTQKDINEPAFSRDGDTLYYSRESWPGDEFTYNKDVHQGIYRILALDLKRGSTHTVVAGPGGGLRPTPSPDGRKLAYVKRNGVDADALSSALVVRDLASGTERIVYGKLDQDAQEVWANYGVYPAFAWTPDGASLVFWAGGKIRRLDLADGRERVIPFRVRQSHQFVKAPRAQVAVAPDEFDVRMLRWVSVSPRGNLAAFQALGHVYLRDLDGGAPRRLTKQSEDFEFYPSFSPDGEWVVYSSWNDAKLGQVRRTHVRNGRTETLTREPGHYLEPVVSPGNRSVVFRSGRAGGLLNPAWTTDPGIREVAWNGGPARPVTKEGAAPQFCGDGARVFLTRGQPHADKPPEGSWLNEDRIFLSVDPNGADPQPLAVTEFATEYRVSPDCRWLARVEMGEILVTPLVATGHPLSLGTGPGPVPQFHAPGDGGEYLSWSADGSLHWALGPDLYSWAFGDEGPKGEVRKRALGFPAKQSKPSGALALTGGRLITMRGDEVIENGTVVVEGNRIVAVGAAADVKVPAGARVVDLAGRSVIPGLIDTHAHGTQTEDGINPQQSWAHLASLALGVTTFFDPAPQSTELFSAAELARVGAITAPRLFGTGNILYGATRDYTAVIESYDDARKQVQRRKAVGATGVKSYLHPRREQRQQIIAAARELGLMVKAEQSMAGMNILAQVLDGTTSIEHNFPAINVYEDVIQLWKQTGVDNVPTLVVQVNGLFGEQYWYGQSDVWRHPILSRYVPPEQLRAESIRRMRVPREDISAISSARSVERMRKAGIRITAGAHGQREGLALHWEMGFLAEGGMKPMDVLRSATIAGAEHLGMTADLGSLEAGKLADLVVLDADPLADIRNTDRIRYVVANGVMFDAATMSAVGGKPRPPLYWER
jgi:imidazolonepropionase-like amidohydrolase/Tol biopolymer transport system component